MYLFMHDESNNVGLAMYHLLSFKQMYDMTNQGFFVNEVDLDGFNMTFGFICMNEYVYFAF